MTSQIASHRASVCEHVTDTCVLSYPSQSSLASHTRKHELQCL